MDRREGRRRPEGRRAGLPWRRPARRGRTVRRLRRVRARTGAAGGGHHARVSRHNQPRRKWMATFVLVHGAWHGSWCWKRVRKALQSAGHDVFTPTLTGVADRSHLASPNVNLEMHVADVVNLIRWEELDDVVLCGHSYSGCVIPGVADRVPERLRALVYLDAFILENGQSLHDTLPP